MQHTCCVIAKAQTKYVSVHNHTGRRKRCLGSFASEREAAEAYDKAALTLRSNISPFLHFSFFYLLKETLFSDVNCFKTLPCTWQHGHTEAAAVSIACLTIPDLSYTHEHLL